MGTDLFGVSAVSSLVRAPKELCARESLHHLPVWLPACWSTWHVVGPQLAVGLRQEKVTRRFCLHLFTAPFWLPWLRGLEPTQQAHSLTEETKTPVSATWGKVSERRGRGRVKV